MKKNNFKRGWLVAVLLAVPIWAGAHSSKTTQRGFADVNVQCQQVRYLRPPPADLPRSHGPGRCDAGVLYYQTPSKASDTKWDKVRECAFRTNDSAVLMLLYANGNGVAPNLGLAMKYACAAPGTQLDVRNRLARLKRQASQRSFDGCTDGSGRLRELCTATRDRQGERVHGDELAALARSWTPKERVGLEMARDAMRYFAEHRADYETDQGSLARSRLRGEAISQELERFLADIEDFQNGNTPRFSESESRALDDRMNQAYRDFMQAQPGPDSYLGSIRKSGVEKTQHAWLAYRDAMELFGSIKYPDVPPSGWRALLTSRRIRQLSELTAAAEGR